MSNFDNGLAVGIILGKKMGGGGGGPCPPCPPAGLQNTYTYFEESPNVTMSSPKPDEPSFSSLVEVI